MDKAVDWGCSLAQMSRGSTPELRDGDRLLSHRERVQEHRIERLSNGVLPGIGGGDTEGGPDMEGGLRVATSAGWKEEAWRTSGKSDISVSK